MLVENALDILKCIHADLVSLWINAYVNSLACKDFEGDMDKAHMYKWLVAKTDCTLPSCTVQDINKFIEGYTFLNITSDCLSNTASDTSCVMTMTGDDVVACTETIYMSNNPMV